jgi:nodulation protein E
MPEVVVTGLGCVTALGVGVETFWSAARVGRSGVRETKMPRWLDHRVKMSAQVDLETIAARFTDSQLAVLDPCSQLALVAAEEAVASAGLSRAELAGPRTAAVVGSCIGGMHSLDDGFHLFYANRSSRVPPLTVPRIMASAPSSHISMTYGITGPVFCVSSACSSGTQSIGLGLMLVRSGVVDRALVGGTDAIITPGMTRAWELLRVLTPEACRPFSIGRNGMVLGDGAAVLVIERADAARARGAEPLATLMGYGTSSDARDLLRPDPGGAAAAMSAALADAGLGPEAIGYVNAHGTGTILNDASEAEALRMVLGPHLADIPVTSTKPIHGHALGASGAIELVAAIMAMRDQHLPPTINWTGPDPACDLDVVPNEPRSATIGAAMSNSFAFGGINACLVVGHA